MAHRFDLGDLTPPVYPRTVTSEIDILKLRLKELMNHQQRTAIVTGASQGIGAGVVKAFAEREFNVVANSRRISESNEIAGSDKIALVDGDIGDPATAQRVAATARSRFGG